MVKKSIPEPFAPGSGRTVADALEPVLAKVRELREQGVGGPWVDVLDTLHAVYWALLTRNASEMVELAATAEALHRRTFLKMVGRENRVGADLFLLVQDVTLGKVLQRPRIRRLETLAAFVQTQELPRAVRIAVRMLPDIAPELEFTKTSSDPTVSIRAETDPAEAEHFADWLSRMNLAAGQPLSPAREHRIAYEAERMFQKLANKAGDGRMIVRHAARLLGLPEGRIKNLFNARDQQKARKKRSDGSKSVRGM